MKKIKWTGKEKMIEPIPQIEYRQPNRLDLMSPVEKAITYTIQEIEKLGASENLTNAQIKLGQAIDLIYEHYRQNLIEVEIKSDGREELEKENAILKQQKFFYSQSNQDKDLQITALQSSKEELEKENSRLAECLVQLNKEKNRFQSSLKEKEKECEELISWKERAMEVMRPLQSIGHSMGVRLGETIHDKILPFIEELKAENKELKEKVVGLEFAAKHNGDTALEINMDLKQAQKRISELEGENERMKKILAVVNDRPDL